MQRAAFRGYLLEELLAWLIRNAGYRLLTDESEDRRELVGQGAGLFVRGRGGLHQADVLGELAWIPAFTFPLRLFVEAKFRGEKVGLPEVRNAVGVLEDVNQNYAPVQGGRSPRIQRFAYRYALFSTSGFTRTATDMGAAHQVSLIDLRGPGFTDLKFAVEQAVEALFGDRPARSVKWPRTQMRQRVRQIVGSWPVDVHAQPDFDPLPEEPVLEYEDDRRDDRGTDAPTSGFVPNEGDLIRFERELQQRVVRLGEFFVGVSNGPFMLLLRAEDPAAFLRYAQANPAHDVHIAWSEAYEDGREWVITPWPDSNAYVLRFGLPDVLADWIFGGTGDPADLAMRAKRHYLSRITVYRHDSDTDTDRLFSLRYVPRSVAEMNRAV